MGHTFVDFKLCIVQIYFRLFRYQYQTRNTGVTEIINSQLALKLTNSIYCGFTVAVFSGRPDPVWQVPSTDVNYRTIKGMLDGAKKYYPVQMPARLGYKGFLVQEGRKDQYLIVGPETQPLQLKLLETMPRDLPGESSLLQGNLRQIREEMKFVTAGVVPSAASSPSTLRAKRYAPSYLPNEWFINPRIRRCNNCYNYANDKRTNTFSQPGLANGQAFQLNNPQTVQTAAEADGLVALNPQPAANHVPGAPAGPRHLVALVVDPGT